MVACGNKKKKVEKFNKLPENWKKKNLVKTTG